MFQGPDYIYQCPHCSKLLKNKSLLTPNMGGAMHFSDGKCEGPMCAVPDLTKCYNCNTIFWLSDLQALRTVDTKKRKTHIWIAATYVDFLNLEDLFRALLMYRTEKRMILIRQWIWWAYNDRVRNTKKSFIKDGRRAWFSDDFHYAILENTNIFLNGKDQKLWEENCRELLKLLNRKERSQIIMIAELHRNLGLFRRCKTILNPLPRKYDWIKIRFEEQCSMKNRLVFRLA